MDSRLRSGVEHGLEIFGVVLILLVGRLVRTAYLTQGGRPVRRRLARRAIGGMVGIARQIDNVSRLHRPRSGDAAVPANRPAMAR